MHAYRTHTCGQLRKEHVGQTVRLSGWVNRRRDHGGLLFIDLRDHYGITQCVIEPDAPAFAECDKARSEWVRDADRQGGRALRPEAVNKDLPTGEVEIRIEQKWRCRARRRNCRCRCSARWNIPKRRD